MSTIMSIEQMEGYYRQKKVECLDDTVLQEAKVRFEYYKNKGVILQGEFSSNEWKASNETKEVILKFDINKVLYKQRMEDWTNCSVITFIDSMKAYILLGMGTFTLETLVCIDNQIRQLPDRDVESYGNGNYAIHVMEFLQMLPGESFIKDEIIEKIQEQLDQKELKIKQRKLASFRSYFHFHDILMNFWEVEDNEKKQEYFPIYLWWRVTAILPLRATEFLLIPRDCLSKTDNYWLTIRRTRLKKGRRKLEYRINADYENKNYNIPDDLATEIFWYRKITSDKEQSKLGTLIIPTTTGKMGYFTYAQMARLLKKFCKDYLDDENYEIHLGDTRHLAMINIILSGGSPVICRELAGHEQIDISSHYYSNMSTLVEDIVYERFRRDKADARMDGMPTFQLSIPKKSVRIKDGYCDVTDLYQGNIIACLQSMDVEGIPGDCYNCIHYYPDNKGLQLSIRNDRKDKLNMDTEFLMDIIEQVRKGYGFEDDIKTALLKLQGSAGRYSIACLWNGEEHGTATE